MQNIILFLFYIYAKANIINIHYLFIKQNNCMDFKLLEQANGDVFLNQILEFLLSTNKR
jgi:hypothetical protein